MNWREDIFDNLVRLKRGFDLPNAKIVSGSFPVVASTSVTAYHHEFRVKGPGVVTGRSGSLGSVQYIPTNYWPLNTALYAKDFKGNHPRFVFYFLQNMRLENFNSGAGVPTLNQNHLHKLKLRLPCYHIQQKIAAILSAYDQLIESNRGRIALLDKLADEIYREWFVRRRFPGHEKAKFVKGVPVGWAVKKLGELAQTQYGYTASAETQGEGPKFLRITDIVPAAIDWALVPHCKIEEKLEEKYLVKEGDILVARTGATVGYAKRINKLHPKTVFASYLVRLIPKRKIDAIFLGLSVERSAFKDFISMFVTGAAQPQANATTMSLFPVLHPRDVLLNEFNRIAEPILDQKEMLLNQNAVLSHARDRLLPRLISGKLSVEKLDIQFPPNMAAELKAASTATQDA